MFEFEKSGDIYYIKSLAFNKYLSAQPDCSIDIDRPWKAPWEEFHLIYSSGEVIPQPDYVVNYGIYAIIGLVIVNVICVGYYIWNRWRNHKKTIRYDEVSPVSDTDC